MKNTVFQIGYIGNQGRHQETEREADTRTPVFIGGNPEFPTYTTSSPRLNPTFASIQQLQIWQLRSLQLLVDFRAMESVERI